ncbi:hypothetical protein [Salmonirosea aquatica]|uniref:PH domain-containing protein n=1 Tax=Salmonirosea aquatica TaxID=2654236 RepID=A0A7C9FCN6_9BACT|nr:hypothetical protein [Cytophagaceae bacterium SJW1-29]
MTTGETILIVLITLGGTVGPWALIIYQLVRASDETFEPVYQSRTYRTSAWFYLFSMDFLLVILLLVFGTFFTTLLSQPLRINDSTPYWVVYSIYLLLTFLCTGVASYILLLNVNYWKYTKDRILTFDPEARVLTVQTDEDEYVLSENDIEMVDVFSNEGYRFIYSYFRFTLRDGRALIITDKTKGAYAIFEFFKNLPLHRHKRRVPTIPQAAQLNR